METPGASLACSPFPKRQCTSIANAWTGPADVFDLATGPIDPYSLTMAESLGCALDGALGTSRRIGDRRRTRVAFENAGKRSCDVAGARRVAVADVGAASQFANARQGDRDPALVPASGPLRAETQARRAARATTGARFLRPSHAACPTTRWRRSGPHFDLSSGRS